MIMLNFNSPPMRSTWFRVEFVLPLNFSHFILFCVCIVSWKNCMYMTRHTVLRANAISWVCDNLWVELKVEWLYVAQSSEIIQVHVVIFIIISSTSTSSFEFLNASSLCFRLLHSLYSFLNAIIITILDSYRLCRTLDSS